MKSIEFIIWITRKCNMSCAYCYEGEKNTLSMSFNICEDVVKYINSVIDSMNIKDVHIVFHGGEPLLEYKLIDYIINKCQLNTNVNFRYELTTNGTIINEEVLDCIKKIDNLSISMDGKYESQLKRSLKNGGSSFSLVKNNIKILLENDVIFDLRMTIESTEIDKVEENIDFFYELGVKRIICAIETWKHEWNDVELENYFAKLYKIRKKYANDNDFYVYGMDDSTYTKKGICAGGIYNRVIDCDGKIYPCSVLCGNREYLIGNIYDGVDNSWKVKLNKYNNELEKNCINCIYGSKCAGRRCVFLKFVCKTLYNNLCKIQKIVNSKEDIES